MEQSSGRCVLWLWLFLGIPGSLVLAMTQHEYFPGLRRPPAAKIPSNSYDENYLAQILNFIEEQARRRFQEKLVNIQQQQQHQQVLDGSDYQSEIDSSAESGFTFKLPKQDVIPDIDEPYNFAVGPNDPRFYENEKLAALNRANELETGFAQGKMANGEGFGTGIVPKEDGGGVGNDLNEGPYFRIKGPLNVNPKQPIDNIYKSKEMQGLLQKLGHNINSADFENRFLANAVSRHDVIQRPVDIEQGSVGIYAVALIAGVSAALTVGLIALGVGWYTFYKKSKAAQDVEYPAYGVTGPNKEMSPTSGDRRLAQNAQMYHYQHQKQQIIAMENKLNEERNGNMSDVNSEDENDEGDYTVYECPGLAPPGEMEVKNPLFFDDPTPATPANDQPAAKQTSPKSKPAEHKSSPKSDPKPKK